MEERLARCTMCHDEHPREDLYEFEDQLLCDYCLEDHTVVCAHCGERIWRDDDAGDADTHLCRSCYDQYYEHCDHCGRVILEEDAYYLDDDSDAPLCEECHDLLEEKAELIHGYYYKPDPIFYGKGPRYLGVELEIDEGGESSDSAREILHTANRSQDLCYIKHDGSLNDGMEIVTHPMSFDFHMKSMPWAEILSKARDLGYTSHQARTCGLHVHVSRLALGTTEEDQDECIARILYIFEKFWDEFLRFSRRTQRQVAQWAARYGMKEKPKEILNHAKKDCEGLRYTCVNLCPENTVEFRIFRGTLKLNTLLATIQLVNHICDVALYVTDEEVQSMSWPDFVSGCQEPELIQYLKERRLYVNEPVVSEEEV